MSSGGPASTTVKVQTVTAPPVFQTTTVLASGSPTPSSADTPPAAAATVKSGDNLPIAAIAGGAVAGVVLALAAVVFWHLWGRSIKRKEAEKRKQAVSTLPPFCPSATAVRR